MENEVLTGSGTLDVSLEYSLVLAWKFSDCWYLSPTPRASGLIVGDIGLYWAILGF